MIGPTTAAGRTLLDAHEAVPLTEREGWYLAESIAAIEAEARAGAPDFASLQAFEEAALRLAEAARELLAATDNATDRGAPDSQWLVRVGGLRPFHGAVEHTRAALAAFDEARKVTA